MFLRWGFFFGRWSGLILGTWCVTGNHLGEPKPRENWQQKPQEARRPHHDRHEWVAGLWAPPVPMGWASASRAIGVRSLVNWTIRFTASPSSLFFEIPKSRKEAGGNDQEWIKCSLPLFLQAGDKHYHPSCARCSRCNQMFTEGEEMYLQGKVDSRTQ